MAMVTNERDLAAALHRLAEEAERRGITILVEPISGEHFATSASEANKIYRLTHHSCSCRGFFRWQRCTHHALLLAQLGWLPEVEDGPEDDPEPDPDPATPGAALRPETVVCLDCRGRGDRDGHLLRHGGPGGMRFLRGNGQGGPGGDGPTERATGTVGGGRDRLRRGRRGNAGRSPD